jgi:hypothetical protein
MRTSDHTTVEMYLITQAYFCQYVKLAFHVEAGLNTLALRIVGGDKGEPSAWGYNRATLFLGDINTGT